MDNLPEVICSNCYWKGKLLLSHLRKNEDCQSKYDITSMENERKEKRKENKRKRKAEKAQQMAETNEKSGQILQSCVNCNWKGKSLNRHLGKKLICSKKYDSDFKECNTRKIKMSHLDGLNKAYWQRIKYSKQYYDRKFAQKYSDSSIGLQICHFCQWKGKHLAKHLVKNESCMKRYDEDFEKCVKNGKRMSHLNKLSRINELQKLRRQIYKQKYYKRNKKYIIKRSKEYFANHKKERRAYKRLVRKRFNTPDDFEGHGPDCFSCKKLEKNKHCLFCNPVDDQFEIYSDRMALNETCLSCSSPVRKIEGINRLQCTSCGYASCFVCKEAVHKSMDKAHLHFYYPYFGYNEFGNRMGKAAPRHPGWEEDILEEDFCPLKTRLYPVSHSEIDQYERNQSPLLSLFCKLDHYLLNRGWCSGSNVGGRGKHHIYQDTMKFISCKKCETIHIHCLKYSCHEYPCEHCKQFYVCHWRCEPLLPLSIEQEVCQICTMFQGMFGHLGRQVSNVRCESCLLSLVPVCKISL